MPSKLIDLGSFTNQIDEADPDYHADMTQVTSYVSHKCSVNI